VLDIGLPRVDGLEVCRRIRAVESDRPLYLIMLTTRSEKHDIKEALSAGADDYVTKPFDADELFARVEVGFRTINLQDKLAQKVRELSEALDQVKTLQGILPICSFCKKIRDDSNSWRRLEEYVSSRSKARFSHSVCPECVKLHYPKVVKI